MKDTIKDIQCEMACVLKHWHTLSKLRIFLYHYLSYKTGCLWDIMIHNVPNVLIHNYPMWCHDHDWNLERAILLTLSHVDLFLKHPMTYICPRDLSPSTTSHHAQKLIYHCMLIVFPGMALLQILSLSPFYVTVFSFFSSGLWLL